MAASQSARYRTSLAFDILLVALLAILIGVVYLNRLALGDWIYFRSYQPTPAVAALADTVGFTTEGRRLFYRGDPTITADKDSLSQDCNSHDTGCLDTKGHIFIYIPGDDTSAATVTAAHETLHLAYRRLSNRDRRSIDELVRQELKRHSNSATLQYELSGYTGDELLDEAHSYLGSEYPNLSPELEQHYAQYFTDRAAITTKAR